MSVICRKFLWENRLEDVDLSKTWPYKYFVHMDRGNQGQKWRGTTQTAINCDTFWLQTLGRHEIVLWQIQKFICYCTVFALFYFVFEGTFQVQAPRGLYSEGRFNGGFFCVTSLRGLYLKGLIHGGAYFRNFTVFSTKQKKSPIAKINSRKTFVSHGTPT